MGSFASSTTAASNSTPTSWKEVSVRLCSIGKTRCSLATIKGRRTGRPSPHLSRPANCMVSIRKPTSPTCSQSSSISGLHRALTSSCLGVGQHSVPPIASQRNDEADSRSRSIQRKNQAIGTVGSENRLQCDGYAAYKTIADDARTGDAITLAFCWVHLRRQFFDIAKGGSAPIASEALDRIAALYAIEKMIRGKSADERRAVRQEKSKPLVLALKTWLEQQLARVSTKSVIAEVIRYGLNHWDGLVRFLDDGRIELDTNIVERSIRPIVVLESLCIPS